jgi:hypothetical protein
MYQIKQSTTAYELLFLMLDDADHVTGKTGLSPTVTIRKANGSFASPAGAVTEIANGWYKVAGNATDTNTLGPLLLHATGTGADPVDDRYEIVAYDPQDVVRLGLTALPNAAADAAGGLPISDAGGLDLDTLLARLDAAITSRMATFTQPTGFLAATFPGTVASPTNITAGTITTVTTTTNLTNAPSDSSGVTTLLSRLSSARAGYLDNLSAGAVALEASVQSLITTIGASAAGVAAAVWSAATRVLTAGTNIVLAKGTGVTGFNDLDATGVRAAVGMDSANLDTRLADIPTVSEFNARTIATASYATAVALGNADSAIQTLTTRLGVPAVSVVDDIAAVKADTGNLITRIPSALFSGITSLAQWLGLIAGKQVGDTTARNELHATGAGSGTFDETTDSVQAIRDRGDAAWTTATGFAEAGDAMTLADSEDVYPADISLAIDGSNEADEYTVQWFRNGDPVTSGITVPLIQVVKRADGTDLIASTAMTQIGSTGAYKYDATTAAERITEGEAVLIHVSATINGSTRTWRRLVSRDAAEV